jgi:hypothetical protein
VTIASVSLERLSDRHARRIRTDDFIAVAGFHFQDDATVAPSAAVLLKERARRRGAVSFAGPPLDKADRV